MSGTGNCFDNAPMESFWGIIKQELINHRHYRTRREAIEDITEYIEIFYNRQWGAPNFSTTYNERLPATCLDCIASFC
jgi:transposase InsO family protein